jgi:hypothetical protein
MHSRSTVILKYVSEVPTDAARAQVKWAEDLHRDVTRSRFAKLRRRAVNASGCSAPRRERLIRAGS